jgi:uncharacterized protein YcbK (DUF882 family)
MGDISTHFSRKEFACSCQCGFSAVDIELLRLLEEAREYFGKPIHINSACRCEAHNKAVGGGERSQHKNGMAADIVIDGVHPDKIKEFFNSKYPDKYGIGGYPKDGFTHIDVRNAKARW